MGNLQNPVAGRPADQIMKSLTDVTGTSVKHVFS